MRRRLSSGLEIDAIQRHLDELLKLLAMPAQGVETGFSPAVDLRESDERYVVLVNVPGVPAEDLAVTLRRRELRVAGRKLPECAPPSARRCHRMERGFGAFSVEVLLPGPVRPEGGEAVLAAGVLRISLPKLAERRDSLHTIPVTTEEP
ncbi:MAG: Hsp20/alpha crystallin family protein [Thermoanaerobaculaceae bacterium]|nr:Hsp20/alpha crystallin family protein [Thermoanaerobaculaceae bacterium]TAM51656.1 MAG: Hsp20/alpha crystallin family protein [Acidobacteriota bacterium]